MDRLKKWPRFFLLDLHSPEKMRLIKYDRELTQWNMMEGKPTEAQILRDADLSSRQQRRTNLRAAIDEYAVTPEQREACLDFVSQLTEGKTIDINDLPVEDRLKLTREGINWFLNKPSNWVDE